ncbi:hypothetical protein BFP78_13290 [Gaetbulibacter sp. 5U11]|nr:hypothetical protein BFP78_13290 [Gaetbulibacter sp. 5U11]
MKKKLDKEKEAIDGYLNTTTITLIGGYLVLFSIKEFNSKVSLWLAIVSLSLFVLTFLFNLWYKYRKTLKSEILEEKTRKCIDKEIEAVVGYADLIMPIGEQKFREIYAGTFNHNENVIIGEHQEKLNRPDLDEKFKKAMEETYKKSRPVVKSISENITTKIFNIRTQVLKKPLKEKNAKIKYIIDYMSFNTRYFLFCTGLFLFILSLILNNIV